MILQDKETGALIEVMDTEELINPSHDKIKGRIQEGQEEQRGLRVEDRADQPLQERSPGRPAAAGGGLDRRVA